MSRKLTQQRKLFLGFQISKFLGHAPDPLGRLRLPRERTLRQIGNLDTQIPDPA